MRDVALEIPLRTFPLGRSWKCHHADVAWVEQRRHPLDDAPLAGRVATFEKDDHAQVPVSDPLLELEQLDLEPPELLLVVLLGQRGRARRLLRLLLAFAFLHPHWAEM